MLQSRLNYHNVVLASYCRGAWVRMVELILD